MSTEPFTAFVFVSSLAMIKHSDQKQLREERVYLSLYFIIEGTQGRNWKASLLAVPHSQTIEDAVD